MILEWFLLITGAEHFPMLVPQPSILKGKRRPDFVCFAPLSKFQYEQVAILVDRAGKNPVAVEGERQEYEQAGFLVKRIEIRAGSPSYFKIARDLATWIENLARCGNTDANAPHG